MTKTASEALLWYKKYNKNLKHEILLASSLLLRFLAPGIYLF